MYDEKCEVFVFKVNELMINIDLLLIEVVQMVNDILQIMLLFWIFLMTIMELWNNRGYSDLTHHYSYFYLFRRCRGIVVDGIFE